MPSDERCRRSRTTTSSISEAPRSRSTRPAPHAGLAPRPEGREAEHVAVLGDEHPVRGDPGVDREPRVLREHAVLAVHGDEVAGPDPAQQLHEVLPAPVARHVDLRGAGVDDVAAEAEEVADEPRDGALVARDGARGEDHGVPGAGRDVAVLADADHGERRERLALAAGHEDDGPVAGPARERAGGDPGSFGEAEEAEVERHLGVVHHAAAEEGDRPAGPDRQVGHALDAGDRRGEAGDEHPAARPLEDLLERGHDGVLAAGEPRLLDVGAVREEREHAAVAPLRERRRRRCARPAAPWRRS